MDYSYSVPAAAMRPAPASGAFAITLLRLVGRRAEADRRWSRLIEALNALRDRGRRSVRIVDAACGDGGLLVEVARRARMLGFVAIEARGIDRDPAHVAHARLTAATLRDPAIGISFEVGDAGPALAEEAGFPADIVLCDRTGGADERVARAAGNLVLRTSAHPLRA